MWERPVFTAKRISTKMDTLQKKFKRWHAKPDPNSKYGAYDDWLKDMKKRNYTQY